MILAGSELRLALAQRRLFILNTLVPLALVLPIALSAAPRAHAAVVFTMLFTFFGVFGQAIPLARDAERGLTGRYFLAGMSAHSFFVQRIAVHALIDFVQLAPTLVAIVLAYGGTGAAAGRLVAATVLALVLANSIGALIATVTHSIAEAALFASMTALLALHAAGVFRTPAAGSVAEAMQHVSPLAGLHQAMQEATSGRLATATDWSGAAAGALIAFGVVLLLAPLLARAIVRVRAA